MPSTEIPAEQVLEAAGTARTEPPEGAAHPVALVTGAGRGIGAQLARALAADGFALGLVGRTERSLRTVAEQIEAPSCVCVADVTRPADVAAAVDTVTARLGPIDVLVNNAGTREQASALPWQADPADWWRVLEVNVRGVMLVTSAVLPVMLARNSGRIIDLGSGIGLRAEPRYSAYSVSKAAALRWFDNVTAALPAQSSVRMVSVSPGLVRTEMTEHMWDASDDVAFGSVEPVTRFVTRFARGELDHLHGRFIHAVRDGPF